MEHYVLHCFRGDPDRIPQLDLVMELDGKIVGQALCVRGEILCDDGRRAPVLNLGPIGIAPEFKRQGYGKRLLDTCLERARALGAGVMVLTGNPDFYGRSGFVPAKTRGIRYADDPEAVYFLLRELKPGYLDGIAGTYRDPAGYLSVSGTRRASCGSRRLSRPRRKRCCRASWAEGQYGVLKI